MKKNVFKKIFNLTWLILAALLTFTACEDDEDTDDEIVLDGIYIMGDATALDSYNTTGRFAVTRNEVLNDDYNDGIINEDDRPTLYEKYIALSATGTFKIKHVAGSVKKQYGPGTDFALVALADRINDEPKDEDFWRGSYTESTTEFSVPEDGLYHVVIDTELQKVVVARVVWGVIGAATPEGWGTATPLTASAFDKNTMTFTKTEMELRGGDWKFRYSNGWKIVLDTLVDLGGGKKGVNVNTNFGGAVNAIIAGGANIVNAAPGVYTITMTWTLADGHSATATKTADLPLTNWTGVICDAVGTGVSADNANAIVPDPSGWAWGNKLLADGAPVKVGDIYTWTWSNMVIEANEGFKLRTENGVAPPSGGANFDAGLDVVDHTASSANVDPATSGDLKVSVKGTYDIVLTIDAGNNDTKKIVITEGK
ncbi:MAG: hypothetical protein A2W99_14665 [Bacteroidetes bacterium GWF2_33_16]|nr:MAG: hypothetical protein A2X00_08875 [Bacteroidetes bacterium GWE2_32_14]OFY04914.1 MAG: hypothetical protein A2W99_14665 [Bacteroidetes bacterium GWF2_33_16]